MICEIGENESREFLREQNIGRLGCCDDKAPYVIPINYYFDGESIYMHSLPGRKINIMRAYPQVCLQTDKIEDAYNWRSVIVFGAYEEILDLTRREQIMSALFKRFPHLTPVESKAKTSSSEIIIFRIRIERISGVAERW